MLDGLLTEIGLAQPRRPGFRPPGDICRCCEAPGAGRGFDVAKTSCTRPAQQAASGVRLPSVRPSNLTIQLEPSCQRCARRMPNHGCVIGISGSNQATWNTHPSHLAQGRGGVTEVLQYLMSVNHLE